MVTKHSILKLAEQDLMNISAFFDLLARFDFEDSKKSETISLQEVKTGSSLLGGGPILESCEKQD